MKVTLEDINDLPLLERKNVGMQQHVQPIFHAEIKYKRNVFSHLVYVAGRYKNPNGKHFLVCSQEKIHKTDMIPGHTKAIDDLDFYKIV